MTINEVVVLSAVRSAIGTFGGALKDMEPAELGGLVVKEAIARSGVDPEQVTFAAVGNCIPTDSRYAYVARNSTVQGGMSMSSTTFAVNRLCGSSQQAIVSSAQAVMLGDADFALAGGVEVMSRAGYMLPALRSGARMGDSTAIDMMVAALTDPFGAGHMGITAENLAVKWGITREQQDAFALESQHRALAAIADGRFKSQIVPITFQTRKGDITFDTDEHPKSSTTLEALAKMRPAFMKGGTVTAGNASGVNDAGSFLIMANAAKAAASGCKPIARLVAYAIAGVPNDIMGEGPIPSSKLALQKAGLTLDQMDVVESNEAFAAQSLAVMQGLGLDAGKTNPNGGAIALGHPVGASGAVIVTKLLHELLRTGGHYGMATMCIGGGQGITTIYERI
ncbi:MAG: acetyl-CoA C-acyltransferase family protein [Sulfuritalea sp.]|jgi:acetyl-CoA C-acetyltransferase|nr:acetyl-CoA C-acyltransferase family protein [Sulfuritalea sp.]MBK8762454.1 acetyl-CoA C-acyltransferase family protein [Sulfuritalea sp.]MBK9352368.1 acetyl-CoA C-acyltransferase family protein [Sulfuritalea sp.]